MEFEPENPGMLNLLSTMDQFRRTAADFLTLDLKTALTFAEIARTSTNPETKGRNAQNAVRAYSSVTELLKRAHLSEEDAQTIFELRSELRDRLAALGVVID